jgi:hypothetical protein
MRELGPLPTPGELQRTNVGFYPFPTDIADERLGD